MCLRTKLSNIVALLCLVLAIPVYGHGYLQNSRPKLCADGVNINCGAVQSSPDDVAGSGRFPDAGPADGTIAAAGSSMWEPLNIQTPTRWSKINMQAGMNTFQWHATVIHPTRDWRYFITKTDWDPSLPLARNAFELTPFCTVEGNFQSPPTDVDHQCNVPQRSGYHVILGIWDIGSLSSSFSYYNVMDVQFPDGSCETAPSLYAPDTAGGSLSSYQWQAQSECTWYQLYVSNSGGVVHQQWYTKEQSACLADASCEISSASALVEGEHTWWIQGWNNTTGYGPWSVGKTFNVSGSCDTKPLPLMPNGSADSNTPTYSWSGNNACSWYQLWTNAGSSNVYQPWHTAAQTNCDSDTSCEITPSTALGSGSHTWWVRGWSATAGGGPWSDSMGFTVP